jgi:replicative DNA helicase
MEDEKSKHIPPPPNAEEVVEPKEVITETLLKYRDNGTELPPPSAIDLEKAILGALLNDNQTGEYIDLLEQEVFYAPKHIHIYGAIQKLHNESTAIDLLTVSEELKRQGKLDLAGGEYYLIQLVNKTSSAAHIEFHVRIVLQKYVLRELIHLSRKTLFKSLHKDPDVFKLMEDIEIALAKIENIIARRTSEDSKDVKEDLKERIERQRQGLSIGYPTGISEFDLWRGGIMKRWLVTIAARPGMGKTTAIVSIMIHMAIEKGISVLFFSLEMPKKDLIYKIAAALTNIDFEKINSGKLTDEEWEHINAALDKIDESPLEIVDDIKNLDKIVSKTRKAVREGAQIAFLDYVQLVETGSNNDNETSALTKTTRTLRALKNELDIPFIQLAQLSREPDKRPGHRPKLSDLKMSGSLEEDSNMVIFILRPEYYNENKSKVPPPPGQINPEYIGEWIVAKGRETGVRDFDISIDFQKTKLESLSDIRF